MKECPNCSGEMVEEIKTWEESVRVAQGNPGIGGYFGEREEEYATSGYGDRYEMRERSKKILKCSKCGHEEDTK